MVDEKTIRAEIDSLREEVRDLREAVNALVSMLMDDIDEEGPQDTGKGVHEQERFLYFN